MPIRGFFVGINKELMTNESNPNPSKAAEVVNKATAIGFPPPYLGEQAQRLPVLARTSDWIALAKPAGVAMREHPWSLEYPNLDSAMNDQLKNEKPELLRLGAECFGSIYGLDPAFSGVALFGLKRDAIATLREAYGDGQIESRIHFIARDDGGPEERVIEAPLLPHRTQSKMIPSSAKGKKCKTSFKQLDQGISGWALWEARVGYTRPHQVRLHAALADLPLMGDTLYRGPDSPSLSELDRRKRGAGVKFPIFDGIAGHLASVQFLSDPSTLKIEAPLPKRLKACYKRMHLRLI